VLLLSFALLVLSPFGASHSKFYVLEQSIKAYLSHSSFPLIIFSFLPILNIAELKNNHVVIRVIAVIVTMPDAIALRCWFIS